MEALQEENKRLKQALKDLTIEKNRLEDRMYRAFHKCLNTKKRKISALQQELEELHGKAKGKRSKRADVTADEENIIILDDVVPRSRNSDGESSNTDIDEDLIGTNSFTKFSDQQKNVDRNGDSSTISPGQSKRVVKPLVIQSDSDEDSPTGLVAFHYPKNSKISKANKIEASSSSLSSTVVELGNDSKNTRSNPNPKEATDEVSSSQETSYDLDDLVNDLCD